MATRSRDIFVSYARQDIDVAAQLAKLSSRRAPIKSRTTGRCARLLAVVAKLKVL